MAALLPPSSSYTTFGDSTQNPPTSYFGMPFETSGSVLGQSLADYYHIEGEVPKIQVTIKPNLQTVGKLVVCAWAGGTVATNGVLGCETVAR